MKLEEKRMKKHFPIFYQKFNVLEILHGHGGNELMEIKIAISDRNDDGFW